jgi:NAD(P)-dependent dehydrogenase (short-subunit alcohol dehydrogenase family)
MNGYESKVAVVTGGASGIGEAIVRRIVAAGGSVAAGDVNEQRLRALADELGDRCAAIPGDVTIEKDLEALVAGAVDRFGAVHVAFNVAGAAKGNAIVDLTEEEWDFTVDLCAKGVVFAIKYEARQMLAQGTGGAIVNIASLNSTVPMYGGAPYCAAKAAAAMITQVAALELGDRGIRVNTISPGLTDTPLTSPLNAVPGLRDAYMERIPMGRAANPDDIAAAAVYLAGDDAAYITGVNLFVDGGWAQTTYPDMRPLFAARA